MPKKRASFSTTYRGDITNIAIIARWLLKNGIRPRSKNELINTAVENIARNVVNKWPELNVLTEKDAVEILTNLGLNQSQKPLLGIDNWDDGIQTLADEVELTEKARRKSTDDLVADALKVLDKTKNVGIAEASNALATQNVNLAKDEPEEKDE